MPTPPAPLPDGLGTAFGYARAVELGVTPRRLRAKDLDTPFRGVRQKNGSDVPSPDGGTVDAGPLARQEAQREDIRRRARAYREIMVPQALFAGRTAAVLLGAWIDHGDQLEVAVVSRSRAPRRHGIQGIKVQADLVECGEFEGFRVSSPASTWAMLGRELDVRALVVLGDSMVRVPRDARGAPLPTSRLATIDQLREAANAGRRRGAPRLRDALSLIRVGSGSPLETDFRLLAAEQGLPEPELDVEIRAEGRLLGIADAVYRPFRTIVEVEGDHHRVTRAQWNRDIEKHAAYVAAGWEIVRLTSAHIRGAHPRAGAMVRSTLVRRGWRA